MTEEEFYTKVKEKYGSRGVRQAKEMMNGTAICDGVEVPIDKEAPYAQALIAKMALIAQQRLSEKYSRQGCTAVDDRRTKTDAAVAESDSAIEGLVHRQIN